MFIIPSYNNVIIRYKTLLSIFMFFVQTIQIKVTSLSLLRKIPPLKVSFMSNLLCLEDRKTFDYHQRKKQLFKAQHPHHRFRVEELDNAHSIHVFNQFEEERYLEFFPYHSRLVDIAGDTLHVHGTPKLQKIMVKDHGKIVYQ